MKYLALMTLAVLMLAGCQDATRPDGANPGQPLFSHGRPDNLGRPDNPGPRANPGRTDDPGPPDNRGRPTGTPGFFGTFFVNGQPTHTTFDGFGFVDAGYEGFCATATDGAFALDVNINRINVDDDLLQTGQIFGFPQPAGGVEVRFMKVLVNGNTSSIAQMVPTYDMVGQVQARHGDRVEMVVEFNADDEAGTTYRLDASLNLRLDPSRTRCTP